MYKLLGFTQDDFELDGGLKAESLWKVCFTCLFGSGTPHKLFFPCKGQHFQGDANKTLVLLYMLFSEKRDSRNTIGLDRGLNSQSPWKVSFVTFVGSDTVNK